MIWFVGRPGHSPRLSAVMEEQAMQIVGDGEVVVPAPAPGDYQISADGESVEAIEPSADYVWMVARAERDARLTRSDWTQLADAPLSDEQRAEWALYRQALRDLPQAQADAAPGAIEWPIAPGE